MSTTVSGTLKIIPSGTFSKTMDDGIQITDIYTNQITETFANGTGANKAQIQYHHQNTLLTTTAETLDLTALATAFGNASLTKLKLMIFDIQTDTAGYRLELGDNAATSNKWTAMFKNTDDVVMLGAGTPFVIGNAVDGYAVDGTHKLLKIYNPSGGSITYKIWIIGEGTLS